MRREPVDILIVLQKLLFGILDIHEPGILRLVYERQLRSRAHGDPVCDALLMEKPIQLPELVGDDRVRIPIEHSGIIRNLCGVASFLVQGLGYVQTVRLRELEIRISEFRGLMGDTGSTLFGDEIRMVHLEIPFPIDPSVEREWGSVGESDQVLSGDAFDNLVFTSFEGRLDQGERHDEIHTGMRHLRVFQILVHRQGDVHRYRPWGRGPREDVGILPVYTVSRHVEEHGDGRVVHIGIRIIHRDFEIGYRRPELCAVEGDALPFVDEILIVELLEYPHDGFHIVAIHRLVGMVEVDPSAQTIDVPLPFG